MGCWNGTCSFTNMPIIEDEDVIVLFTERVAHHQGSSCYDPSNILSPITMPMVAKYNDYGGAYGFVESPLLEFNKKVLERYLSENEEKHDFDYSNGIDLEIFTKHVERSSCQDNKIDDVVLLFIKLDVYTEMCEYFETIKGRRTPIEFFNDKVKMFEMFKDPKKNIFMDAELCCMMFKPFNYYFFENDLSKYLYDIREDENKYNEMMLYTKHFFLYDSLLSHMRMMYEPGSGAGSQYKGGEHYSKFYEVCLKESKRIQKDY